MPQESDYSWSDSEFEKIIEMAMSDAKHLSDISSPPGTKKTQTVIRFAIKKRTNMIASFPTHQNQETALRYAIDALNEYSSPPVFVLDYAGVERYCIFYRIDLIKKFLDKYKLPNDDSYVGAVQNMLGSSSFSALLKNEISESIFMKIAQLLDNSDIKGYSEFIKNLIERQGQTEICRKVCPLGLQALAYRKVIAKKLANPKVITWRKELVEKIRQNKKYKNIAKNIVIADPSRFLEFDLEGREKEDVTKLLCPRLLLINKFSATKKGKTNFISTRKTLVLTPHASLDFVINVIKRQLSNSNIDRDYILFIDEYDSLLLKPKRWKVIPLDAVRAEIKVADKILSTHVGEKINGIEVDLYLKQYAEYVKSTLEQILEIVSNSIDNRTYHPLANLFVEGALSMFDEIVLNTNTSITYKPLGFRAIHIKHFVSKPELLQRIMNPKLFLYVNTKKEDIDAKIRESISSFNAILNAQTYIGNAMYVSATPDPNGADIMVTNNGKAIRYRRQIKLKRIPMKLTDVLDLIRDYISPLLIVPRFATLYEDTSKSDYHELYLASVDVQIAKLLSLTNKLILASATGANWSYLVQGSADPTSSSVYQMLVDNAITSLITIDLKKDRKEYDSYVEDTVKGNIAKYTPEFANNLKMTIEGKSKILKYDAKSLINDEIPISQITPLIEKVGRYAKLLRVIPEQNLNPIAGSLRRVIESRDANMLINMLLPYLKIVNNAFQNNKVVLILAQNKTLAKILAILMKATPCIGENCNVPENKAAFYVAKNKIIITWYRGRATRGIDIPFKIEEVVAFSSYPRPRYLVNNKNTEAGIKDIKLAINYYVKPLNSQQEVMVFKTLLPIDMISSVAELVQAIGRATRSAMKMKKSVTVYMPLYLMPRITALAPNWLNMAIKLKA